MRGVVAALERRHRHLVDADDAHDFLDDVGLAVHIGAPGGHGDLHHRAAAGDHEAEMAEDAPHLDQRHLDAGQALDLAQREIDDAVLAEGVADDDVFRRRAAAQFHHQLGRELQPRHHEGRIDAALEAIARIRIDAELAAGLRDVDLVPQRRFDQHVGGVLVAAGGLAAHDAGERFDAVIVRDHADRRDRACRCGRRAPAGSRRRLARRTVRLPFTFLASNTCSGRARS